MFIDTHAHLYGEEFDNDRSDVVERACAAGADKIFLPCIDETSIGPMNTLCAHYPNICYPMLGLHPTELPPSLDASLIKMEKLLQTDHSYIAIGEVGLDFYWDDRHKTEQIHALNVQTEWAVRYHLPLMIHSRSAHQELIEVLQPYVSKGIRGVFHCFSGTSEEADELLSIFPTFMLGIGGIVTFKKSTLPAILAKVPLSRIVIETDSPYLAPTPHRGKRNESGYIPFIIEKLAEIYNTSPATICKETVHNTLQVFPKAN
ncbi:MAG: TatD family hydrolase [Bacteroidaceae bacterium]